MFPHRGAIKNLRIRRNIITASNYVVIFNFKCPNTVHFTTKIVALVLINFCICNCNAYRTRGLTPIKLYQIDINLQR